MLSIGMMSGTSMDGIDAALLETDGTHQILERLGHVALSYQPVFKIALKAAEYAVRRYLGDVAEAKKHFKNCIIDYCEIELGMSASASDSKMKEITAYFFEESTSSNEISFEIIVSHLTYLHGIVVNKLLKEKHLSSEKIDVVGFHGQCFYHQPNKKISVIVGDGQALADQINITVVDNFRAKDIEAGGQGAPFAPFYHQALAIKDKTFPLAVLNCGGIANITLIYGPDENDLIAFDAGPGNGLIDRLVRLRTEGRVHMDFNGCYGLRGNINHAVLERLMHEAVKKDDQNYLFINPPKSLDIGDLHLIPELLELSLEDACATLEAFTAKAIVESLDLLEKDLPHHWILAGGGWNNPVIYRELQSSLMKKIGNNLHLQTADEFGWDSQALEAQIFAYLAVRSLQNMPLSTYNTTGVPVSISGGDIHKPLFNRNIKNG